MMVLRERIIKITEKVEIIIIIIGEERLGGSCLMRYDSKVMSFLRVTGTDVRWIIMISDADN